MPLSLADRIQTWLRADTTKWELDDAVVVEWARPFGADERRAWRECPRADFLMALAGTFGVPREFVLRAACVAAREALAFVPTKMGPPRKAVYHAECYRPSSNPRTPAASDLAGRTLALLGDSAVKEEKRLAGALADARRGAVAPTAELALESFRDPEIHASVLAAANAPDPPALHDPMRRLADAATRMPAVKRWAEANAAYCRFIARAHAIRAAAAVAVAADSARVFDATQAMMSRLMDSGTSRPAGDDTLGRALTIADRSGTRVYTESALVFDHAAAAFGMAAAAEPSIVASQVTTLLTHLHRAAGDPTFDVGDQPGFQDELDAIVELARSERLRLMADAVRTIITPEALALADHPVLDEQAIRRDPRPLLLRATSQMLSVVRFLGESGVADALEVAQALLKAPGPLNRKALAPVLRTIHERTGDMFRQRMAETVVGPEHDKARAAVASAQAAEQELREMLAVLGAEPSN